MIGIEELKGKIEGLIKQYAPFITSSFDSFSVDKFSTYFEGGARAYLFKWKPGSPTSGIVNISDDYIYLVKASSIPQSSVEEIVTEYQHLNFKMGGKRVFDDWTLSFLVDIKSKIRGDFEKWMNGITQVGKDNIFIQHYLSEYTSTQDFYMLDGDGLDILHVTLFDAWPKTIGPVTMDYSSQDFAQFDVTFSYLYHEIKNV